MHSLSRDDVCPNCGRYANRGVSVDAVVIRDSEILLIKRGGEPFKGFWGTPGGFVEWDESTEDAVRRELKEETGLTAEAVKLINVYSNPARHPRQVINAAYLVEILDGEPIASDDAEAVEWFPLDGLPENMAFDHRQIIDDARNLS